MTKNPGKIETAIYRKSIKLTVLQSLNIPKQYKQNGINSDLHCSKRISANLDHEVFRMKKKFSAANYPQKFVETVICNSENIK